VPLILITQAVLSYVPCQVWRFLNRRSGIHLSALMDAAHVSSEASYLEIREKAIRYITNQMDRYSPPVCNTVHVIAWNENDL